MQRVLLLGTGNIARHHVQEFAAIAEADIVACADLVPGRAAAFAAEHGIAGAFQSLDQAIDGRKGTYLSLFSLTLIQVVPHIYHSAHTSCVGNFLWVE